jgi:hypothetical protein
MGERSRRASKTAIRVKHDLLFLRAFLYVFAHVFQLIEFSSKGNIPLGLRWLESVAKEGI